MTRPRRPPTPITGADLERLALRYVERYATTRARLAAYLERKLRERGWAETAPPDPHGMAQRMADLGYVDDRGFAESKATAMGRRGFGARRVREALRHAGVEAEDSDAIEPSVEADAGASAIAFARRKRIGPFGRGPIDRPQQEKQLAAMLRAGHAFDLARRIVRMEPGENTDDIVEADAKTGLTKQFPF